MAQHPAFNEWPFHLPDVPELQRMNLNIVAAAMWRGCSINPAESRATLADWVAHNSVFADCANKMRDSLGNVEVDRLLNALKKQLVAAGYEFSFDLSGEKKPLI